LNGREATITRLKELNKEFRADAEYHQKRYLREDIQRKKYSNVPLGEIAFITDGQHGYHEVDENSDISLLTAKNAKNWFANKIDADTVAQWVDDDNKRSSLQVDDLILSTRGSVGYCAIVIEDALPANIDQDVARIAIAKENISPHFVLAYLNSSFGQDWIQRNATGMVQQGVSLAKLGELPIPILSNSFQTQIENLIKQAQAKLEESKALYSKAENLLINELGLRSFAPSTENTTVKSFRESFLQTGRLDAEYYHPEKDSMLDWLAKFQGKSVGSYASLIDERIDPNQGFSSEFVCNFDLTDALEIYLGDRQPIPAYELGSTKKVMKKGDVVISRLRSYLKEIAIVDTPDELNVVGSSEFIVLRLDNEVLNAETLLVYLRSFPVQQILKWCQSGSNHPRFMEKDLLAIKLPDKVLALQNTFQLNIRAAINKSRESKRLLETAKRAVEIAIEEDEQAVLVFIKSV
jgi:restriction endonuclease S subunit